MAAATNIASSSKDPLIRTVWHGLHHLRTSVEAAFQVAYGIEMQRAGRFMTVMDTTITLAPLLGLLGTVTGIMGSFNFVGSSDLAPTKVSGGISEALIATASGLGIAIFTLIFFNVFNAKLARLQFELDTTSNEVILMLASLRNRNDLITDEGAGPAVTASRRYQLNSNKGTKNDWVSQSACSHQRREALSSLLRPSLM